MIVDEVDPIELERVRCAEILSRCIQARRPCLALAWIASGASVSFVVDQLFYDVCAEQQGAALGTIESEFDHQVEIFVGLDVSRSNYLRLRRIERSLSPGRCSAGVK